MASVTSTMLWRLATLKRVTQPVLKLYLSTDVRKTERIFDRMKKFVLGEGAPQEESEETMDSYYQLAKVEEPLIYSMETHEVLDTLQNIVSEVVPYTTGDQWENQSISDLVVKYKVLSRCHQEFGLLVPNCQLNTMSNVQDVIHYYTTAKPKDTRTFKSIDMDKLPPNLVMGGKVPFKTVSS